MFRKEIEGEVNILKTVHVRKILGKVKPSIDEKILKKYE